MVFLNFLWNKINVILPKKIHFFIFLIFGNPKYYIIPKTHFKRWYRSYMLVYISPAAAKSEQTNHFSILKIRKKERKKSKKGP